VGVTPAATSTMRQVFGEAARAAHVTVTAGFNRLFAKRSGHESGTARGLFPRPGAQWGVAISNEPDSLAGPAHTANAECASWLCRLGTSCGIHHCTRAWWSCAPSNGFTMARAAQRGLLTFSDAYGRILGETSSSHSPVAWKRICSPVPGLPTTPATAIGSVGYAKSLWQDYSVTRPPNIAQVSVIRQRHGFTTRPHLLTPVRRLWPVAGHEFREKHQSRRFALTNGRTRPLTN